MERGEKAEIGLGEEEMLDRLRSARRVFLLEPNYRRKYLPLGLAKIATLVKRNGGRVWFGRRYFGPPVDLICATSLFTYDSLSVVNTLNHASRFSRGTPILAGGIYASLMPKDIERRTGSQVELFTGYSPTLDELVPDYSLQWGMEDRWDEFSFTFTSRGCPNRCSYCAVWRIEPEVWINPRWKEHIVDEKPCAMISDNNLSAAPLEHLHEVLAYLAAKRKKVVFDNGFDAKHITEDMAKRLAKLKYIRTGMRLAFDRIEEDGVFQAAIERLVSAGMKRTDIMVYALFNFKDTPREAAYRMGEIRRLGVRPYPQQYMPLNQAEGRREKKFIGRHWTEPLVRAFRLYWLMAGIYGKHDFEEWARAQDKIELSDADWEKWNA